MSKVKNPPAVFVIVGLIVFFSLHVFSADFHKARESAIKPGRFHLGPLQIVPQITLENIGYTDNIYQYSNEARAGWMADLGLRVKAAAAVGRRLVLIFETHPYYSYFSAVDTERAFNHTNRARLFTRVAGIHLMYSLEYDNRRWRPNREFAARVRNQSTYHYLEADIGNHDALFITAYAGILHLEFSEDGFMEQYDPGLYLDRDEQVAGLKLNLPVFTATQLSLKAELREYRFDRTRSRDGKSLVTGLDIRFPEIGHLTGSASLGYKRYFPEAPGYKEFNALSGTGHITYRFMRRWRLGLDYNLDAIFSFISPDNYFNESSFQGSLDYYISRNLRLGGSYRNGRYDYRRLENGVLQFRDTHQYFEIRAAFRLAGTTGVGLTFRRGEWDSRRTDLKRDYYFIGGFVTHDF